MKEDCQEFSATSIVWEPLATDLARRQVTEKDLASSLGNEKLREYIANAIANTKDIPKMTRSVRVDYRRSLNQMIKNAGISSVSPDISEENFPREKSGKSKIHAFPMRFDRSMFTVEICTLLHQMSCRPGTLYEFLAFIEQCLAEGVSLRLPCVAMKPAWKKEGIHRLERVVLLRSFGAKMRLNTSPIHLRWKNSISFLAVFEK